MMLRKRWRLLEEHVKTWELLLSNKSKLWEDIPLDHILGGKNEKRKKISRGI